MELLSSILIYKLWKNKLSAGDTLFINKSSVRLGIKGEKRGEKLKKHIHSEISTIFIHKGAPEY
jgi:hypothetical protein